MNECLVWAALSDKAAADEPLTGEERLFLRRHPSECPGCAPEATLWANLEKVLEEPERLTSRSNFERPRQASGRRLGQFVSGRFRQHQRLLAVLALGAAAAAAAIWRASEAPPLEGKQRLAAPTSRWPSSKAAAGNPAGAQLALSAGETLVNQRPALAGERLATGAVVSVGVGQACLLVPPGVSVCLAGGSELLIETLQVGTRRFRLLTGQVAAHLEPQPAGSTFGFETPAGSIVAKGTEFSLSTDGSSVSLRVHEGVVLNRKGTETSAYEAPSATLLSHQRGPSLPMDEALGADARLVALTRYFSDRSRGLLAVTAAEGSNVALGGFSLGMAPLSALVQPGDFRLEVSKTGFASIVERLKLEPGSRVARDYGATTEVAPTEARAGVKVLAGAALPTASELLERARELRAAGRYKDANGAYQRLLRDYAGSAEARVALVSLGELQLSQLGDAGGALRSFDAYLRGGGALRQEASYGRIRALRRLGKLNDAQAAAAAFIRTYPSSVQAATLRKELP